MKKTNGILILMTFIAALLPAAPVDAEARQRALAAAESGRWSEAEPVLTALTADGESDVQALAALARYRQEQKRHKEAVALLKRAVQLSPKDSQLHSALGHALARRIGEVNFVHQGLIAGDMLTAYETAVALDSNNLGAWIGLVRYHAEAPAIAGGSLEKAETYAREVERRDPRLGARELAFVFEKAGRTAEAAEQRKKAEAHAPAPRD